MDLSAQGGSSAQPLYDDGTHGDVTAGDSTFSYQVTVPPNVAAGSTSLVATVIDAQRRTATIAVTVLVAAPMVTVRAIQLAKPSPYAKQAVTTTGVVVSVKTNGFLWRRRMRMRRR